MIHYLKCYSRLRDSYSGSDHAPLVLGNERMADATSAHLSLALWSRLPAAFSREAFSRGIPSWIAVPENILRILVFVVPALFPMGWKSERQRRGWVLYGVGIGAYAASYVMQIAWPDGAWSTSLVGFVAPAWTTLLWLVGISCIAGPAFFLRWFRWKHYLVLAVLFVAFHLAHATMVYYRS